MSYAINPAEPLPRRWQDRFGQFRIMAGPVEGYVMCRRPHCVPFVLHVRELLGSSKHPHQNGPFKPAVGRKRAGGGERG